MLSGGWLSRKRAGTYLIHLRFIWIQSPGDSTQSKRLHSTLSMPVLSTLTGGTRRCHEQALGSVEMCGASLFAKNNASNSICSTCVTRRLSRPRLSGKKYDHLLHDVINIGGFSGIFLLVSLLIWGSISVSSGYRFFFLYRYIRVVQFPPTCHWV